MRPDASTKLASVAPKKGPNKGLIGLAVLLVVALIAAGVYLVTKNKDDSATDSSKSSVPKNAEPDGKGINVYPGKAKSDAKTVDVYEDFQCPVCKHLEDANGKDIEKLASDGTIKLRYHVLSFLDDNLNNDSSKRAANAAFCAADQNKFLEFHNTVFANQPTKEGAGYTNDQLKDFGKKAGLSGDAYSKFTSCVDDQHYKGYVSATENRMGPDNVNQTPTLKINGKTVDMNTDVQDLIFARTTFDKVLAKY